MDIFTSLISEFSNPIRIKILLILDKENATLSEITKSLGGKSNSEVSRNLSRLAEKGFVQKESIPGRKYELTPFGKISILLFAPLQFIFKNGDFFKNHRIDSLPIDLRRDIGALSQSEYIQGAGNVIRKMKEYLDMPIKELWIKFINPFPFELKIHTLNLIIPPELGMLKEKGEELRKKYPKINTRVVFETSISLSYSNLGLGMIFFPNLLDKYPDFNCCFYVSDSIGIKYLKKIWQFFWNEGKKPE